MAFPRKRTRYGAPSWGEVMCRQAYVQRQALELYAHLMRVPPSLVVAAP